MLRKVSYPSRIGRANRKRKEPERFCPDSYVLLSGNFTTLAAPALLSLDQVSGFHPNDFSVLFKNQNLIFLALFL
jgi:hypothetical protein